MLMMRQINSRKIRIILIFQDNLHSPHLPELQDF